MSGMAATPHRADNAQLAALLQTGKSKKNLTSTPFAVCRRGGVDQYSRQVRGSWPKPARTSFACKCNKFGRNQTLIAEGKPRLVGVREVLMRNISLALSAIIVAVVLASFTPIPWSTAPHQGRILASISTADLTAAAGTLPASEQADSF
jgi:hypothetical protein